MTKQITLARLSDLIVILERKIADTQYFIETASCLETKTIYQNTEAELIEELAALYQLHEQLKQNQKPVD